MQPRSYQTWQSADGIDCESANWNVTPLQGGCITSANQRQRVANDDRTTPPHRPSKRAKAVQIVSHGATLLTMKQSDWNLTVPDLHSYDTISFADLSFFLIDKRTARVLQQSNTRRHQQPK